MVLACDISIPYLEIHILTKRGPMTHEYIEWSKPILGYFGVNSLRNKRQWKNHVSESVPFFLTYITYVVSRNHRNQFEFHAPYCGISAMTCDFGTLTPWNQSFLVLFVLCEGKHHPHCFLERPLEACYVITFILCCFSCFYDFFFQLKKTIQNIPSGYLT